MGKQPQKLTIELNLLNSAFEESPEQEIARILREIADKLEMRSRLLFDVNGNNVGHMVLWVKGGQRE